MIKQTLQRRKFLVAAGGSALLAGPLRGVQAAPAGGKPASRKKGACFVTRADNDWLKRVKALDAHWLYSWGANQPAGLPKEVEFCPMLWGGGAQEKFATRVSKLHKEVQNGKIQHVMGFNEPDQHEQSNMTVEQAVELWPLLMELGVPLVSPGCVHPDREWMHAFMEQVERRKLRVDFVAVHSYGGANADALLKRLHRVSREYGRPVWVTEFAVGDWEAKSPEGNRHRPERVARFMAEALPAMESASFVDRYAWFSAGQKSNALGTSALFDDQGGLTPLGELYRSI